MRSRFQCPIAGLDNGAGSQSRRGVPSRGAVSMGSHSIIEVLLLLRLAALSHAAAAGALPTRRRVQPGIDTGRKWKRRVAYDVATRFPIAWPPQLSSGYVNPDKGFSGSGFELIAGLKVALGFDRVDLVGGDGRDDVNEGVDGGSMLGQIEGRELLDMADVGHVPRVKQGFILQR